MWWQYCLVFLGALLFDIVPFPFLPAFTIMIFLQLVFDLNIWTTICIGVEVPFWADTYSHYTSIVFRIPISNQPKMRI